MNKFKELAEKLLEAHEAENNPDMKAINWQVIWDLLVEIVPIILKKLIS